MKAFITITGLKFHFGSKPFEVGQKVKLVKEPALVRIQQPSILTNNREYASKRRSPDIVLSDRVSKIRCRDLSLPH